MTELSQLRLRCRRGMKELDIVLNKYLDESYGQDFTPEKTAFKSAFQELLLLEDPVLYAMLMGHTEPENAIHKAIILKLRQQCTQH
ncbi:MAG: succinate dehydrogenase assembly factor 2 [Thiotrichaceae bacterium]